MKRLMSLWGKGAKAEDEPKEETEEEKAAREKAEKEAADKKAAEDKAAAEDDADEEEEDEDDDEATKAAAAAVPAKVRASIIRAERSRIHAIVDGGGRDRVETSLQLALGTSLTAKAALAIVATTASQATTPPAGGRLGLAAEMAARPQRQLGPTDAPAGGPQTEVDKAAASILKHVSKASA